MSFASPLSPTELARYSRHLSLQNFGMAAQQKLRAARVVVVGAGGLGSPALLYLAAAGVGHLGIVEFDRVDVSNLQRQVLYDTDAVGQSKADAARTRLLALNPHLHITLHPDALNEHNVMSVLRDYDVVLDGTDQFGIRYLINDACVILDKPLVSAAIHRFEGQAFTYLPHQGPCYRCLFPEPPPAGAVPNCAEAGVLGVLPGVMGTIQATEAIKLITHIGQPLLGRLLTYDALDMRFDEFSFGKRDDCAVCGTHPSITTAAMSAASCTIAAASSTVITSRTPVDISASELKTRLQQALPLLLLDVREVYEFEAGHLPDAMNVPLSELPLQLDTLPTDRQWIVMCRGGGRSAQACELIGQKLPNIAAANLQGGLLAWQAQVDVALVVA